MRFQEKEPLGFGINNQLQIIAQTEVSQIAPPCVSIK